MVINLFVQDWKLSASLSDEIIKYLTENVEARFNTWSGVTGHAYSSKNKEWMVYSGLDYVFVETEDKKHETHLTLLYGETYGI